MSEINLDYFKDLSIKEILCLARKSIQITAENRKLEDKLGRIEELAQDFNGLVIESKDILKIIKEN